MFSQDSTKGDGLFEDEDAVEYTNKDNSSKPMFSLLGDLDDYFLDGYLTFKWVWPELSGVKNYNIWRQTANPLNSTESSYADGYDAIDINWDGGGAFAGTRT